MFKHILLPTDGSAASDIAIQRGVQLARDMGAKVTGIHVVAPFHTFTYRADMIEDTEDQYEKDSEELARKVLATIERQAQECGVACDVVVARSDDTYQAIIETASARGCDLIVMASHGRRGVRGLLLGSETQKVLTHSTLPVLIYR
jgi:nucleotide-binding universal stress UspA family protein